ncbi:MAG: hypothetical protein Q7S57_00295 [bacterium]|nr:hypothetical protein [bacterium]
MNMRDFCRQVKQATKKLGLRWSYALGAIRSQRVLTPDGGRACLCPLTAIRYLQVGRWEDWTLASNNLGLKDDERRKLSKAIDCKLVFCNREEKKLRRRILRACGQ